VPVQAEEARRLVEELAKDASVVRETTRHIDPRLQRHMDPYQLLHKLSIVTEEIVRRHSQWQAMMLTGEGDGAEWEVEDSSLRFLLDEVEAESRQYPSESFLQSRSQLKSALQRLEGGLSNHKSRTVANNPSPEWYLAAHWNNSSSSAQHVTPFKSRTQSRRRGECFLLAIL